jgi:hypothetical protein
MNDTYWQNNLDLVGSVQWNTPLGQCQVFNLPSPNFGVSASSINLGLSMSSTIQLELCWSFEMDIGFSNVTGMFLDVTDTNLITYVLFHKRSSSTADYLHMMLSIGDTCCTIVNPFHIEDVWLILAIPVSHAGCPRRC